MKINNLNLEWTGHSGFFITNSKKIYIDPYNLKYKEKADIILITHSHYDHCSIEDLKKIVSDNCLVICPADCSSKLTKLQEKIKIQNLEPGQEISLDSIKVKAVPAYNTNKQFHSKQEYWNGYILDFEGTKIYHAGDTDLIPEMSQIGKMKIDVALLPVSGVYTMNAEEAAKAAFIIKPKLAIPMHYSSIVGSREDAEKFRDLCEQEGIKVEVMENAFKE